MKIIADVKKIKNQNGIRVEGVVEDSQDDGSGN